MDNSAKSGPKNMVLVRFLQDNVEYACTLSRIRNRDCLRPGDIRDVKWENNEFYPAKIKKIRSDGQVDVIFTEDNVKYRTQIMYIAESDKLKVGDKRLVKWTDGRYYDAIILKLGERVPKDSLSQDKEMNKNSNCIAKLDYEKQEPISKSSKSDETTAHNILPSRDLHATSNMASSLESERLEAIKQSTNNGKQKLLEGQSNTSPLSADLQHDKPSNSHDIVTEGQDTLYVKSLSKQKKKTSIKRNWCIYCCQMQSKIGRHMAAKHKDITEVQQYIAASTSKIKKEIMHTIINKCNSEYNQKVLDKELEGPLIPVKKSDTSMTSTSHAICTSCGGLFSKINLSTHKITCINRQKLIIKDQPADIPNFSLACPTIDSKFEILKKRVLKYLTKDEITKIIINDPLILEFGRRFLKGHMGDKQRNYVACKLRTVGDLVCRMKMADPVNIKSLTDCLKVTNFELLCGVVKEWSAYDDESGVCGVGSVPRRLCKSLKVCSQVEWSEAIKNKDIPTADYQKIRDNHDKFMNLMNNDWALEVNCPGDKSLKTKKLEKEDKMPLADDIIQYFNEITTKLENFTENLKQKVSFNNYTKLCKTTLAYLIAFNCRRPSEVSYATIENYSNRNKSSNESNKLVVFMVSATKNDTKVPVIVPDNVQLAIDILLKSRKTLKIAGHLLFSKPDGKPYNGSNILMQEKNNITLKKPDHFTANGLRHYWATVSQMDDKIKTHMPKFLGHTLATHQKFYEMPMTDIHLDVIGPSIAQHYNIIRDIEQEGVAVSTCKNQIAESADNFVNNITTPKKREYKCSDESSSCEDSFSSPLKMQKRNRWTTPEKKELLTKLPKTLLGIEPAGKGKIREVWENSKVIKKHHSLQMTRIEVSKYFTKKKKIPTPLKKQLKIVE